MPTAAREMFADARAAFIAAGLTETAYFFVSIIGSGFRGYLGI